MRARATTVTSVPARTTAVQSAEILTGGLAVRDFDGDRRPDIVAVDGNRLQLPGLAADNELPHADVAVQPVTKLAEERPHLTSPPTPC